MKMISNDTLSFYQKWNIVWMFSRLYGNNKTAAPNWTAYNSLITPPL